MDEQDTNEGGKIAWNEQGSPSAGDHCEWSNEWSIRDIRPEEPEAEVVKDTESLVQPANSVNWLLSKFVLSKYPLHSVFLVMTEFGTV